MKLFWRRVFKSREELKKIYPPKEPDPNRPLPTIEDAEAQRDQARHARTLREHANQDIQGQLEHLKRTAPINALERLINEWDAMHQNFTDEARKLIDQIRGKE